MNDEIKSSKLFMCNSYNKECDVRTTCSWRNPHEHPYPSKMCNWFCIVKDKEVSCIPVPLSYYMKEVLKKDNEG